MSTTQDIEFVWSNPAEKVYVGGSFNDWNLLELKKNETNFSLNFTIIKDPNHVEPTTKVVILNQFLQKNIYYKDSKVDIVTQQLQKTIYYKFFVDNVWVCDPSKPTEMDEHGNVNNKMVFEFSSIEVGEVPHPEEVIENGIAVAAENNFTRSNTNIKKMPVMIKTFFGKIKNIFKKNSSAVTLDEST